jgi:hypothetical protein
MAHTARRNHEGEPRRTATKWVSAAGEMAPDAPVVGVTPFCCCGEVVGDGEDTSAATKGEAVLGVVVGPSVEPSVAASVGASSCGEMVGETSTTTGEALLGVLVGTLAGVAVGPPEGPSIGSAVGPLVGVSVAPLEKDHP